MTPFELQLAAAVYAEGLQDAAKSDRQNLYLLSCLIRTAVWAKHSMPSYAQVFPDDVRQEEMTDDAMFAQVKALNKLFGGKEV